MKNLETLGLHDAIDACMALEALRQCGWLEMPSERDEWAFQSSTGLQHAEASVHGLIGFATKIMQSSAQMMSGFQVISTALRKIEIVDRQSEMSPMILPRRM
jgi:hypothetical protein